MISIFLFFLKKSGIFSGGGTSRNLPSREMGLRSDLGKNALMMREARDRRGGGGRGVLCNTRVYVYILTVTPTLTRFLSHSLTHKHTHTHTHTHR